MKRVGIAAMAAAAMMWTVGTAQALETGAAAPDFTLTDSNGQEHSLSDFKGKYVVLEWVNFGCPFVKKFYSNGDMQAMQEKYTGKDVVWLSICSSAPGKQGHFGADEVAQAVADHNSKATGYLIDEDGTVGKTYNAKTTPHMYVIDPDQNLIYQGAIDSIRSTSSDDIAKADNYVKKALKAAMAGEPIDPASTQAYGCSVKYGK